MNFEEWYAQLGEWIDEDTSLNMSHAAQRHLAKHLEKWQQEHDKAGLGLCEEEGCKQQAVVGYCSEHF